MNGSVQRTIPNVMLPFRSMIPKSRSAAYYGSEYQLPHYAATDILPSRSALWPAYMPPSPTSKCSKTSKIKPSPKMGPGFPLPRTIGNGAEYQLGHYVPTDILPSCVRPSGSVPRICQARLILPAVPDGPAFGLRPAVSGKSPSSWRRNIRCRIMRHLIFSIVGSPPESPSVNPPGAGTIGFETEYQVQHNVAPDISCRWFVF